LGAVLGDRHASHCPNQIFIIVHDGMEVYDGAHWLFVMKKTAVDPDDILAHTSLSILYQKKGMVPEAEAEGNKARVLGWKQQLKKGSA